MRGKVKKGRLTALALVVGLVTLVGSGASLAYDGSADSTVVADGSPNCPSGTTAAGSFTIDPWGNGSNGTFYNGWITFSNSSATSFDWALTSAGEGATDPAVVIVSGASSSVLYTYDYADGGGGLDDSDSGLTAPEVDGKPGGISLVRFCFDQKDDNPAPPKLIVRKVIVGSPNTVASSFSFTANGTTYAFEADGENEVSLPEGSYTVREIEEASLPFKATYENCTDVEISSEQKEAPLCVITNTKDETPPPPTGKIRVKKVVVGSNDPFTSFSFTVNGQTTAFEADSENSVSLPTGATYNVTEPAAAGYTTTYSNCTGLAPDDEGSGPLCTVTNTKTSTPPPPPSTGHIRVKKVVVGSNDSPSAFSFSVGGSTYGFEGDGENSVTLRDGTLYTVTEPAVAGYTTSYSNCSGLDPKDDIGPLCTITNMRNVIDVAIQKSATPQVVLNGTVTYTLTVTNVGSVTATDVQVGDAAPAGITFLSASGASCSVGTGLITCNRPGGFAPGASFTVTVSAKAVAAPSRTPGTTPLRRRQS
jgi:uncharacterized repeat protein (TIGR01451 family)